MPRRRVNAPGPALERRFPVQQKPNRPLPERVERGIYKRETREGVTRYEAFLDSDSRQRWGTVGSLREARQLPS